MAHVERGGFVRQIYWRVYSNRANRFGAYFGFASGGVSSFPGKESLHATPPTGRHC